MVSQIAAEVNYANIHCNANGGVSLHPHETGYLIPNTPTTPGPNAVYENVTTTAAPSARQTPTSSMPPAPLRQEAPNFEEKVEEEEEPTNYVDLVLPKSSATTPTATPVSNGVSGGHRSPDNADEPEGAGETPPEYSTIDIDRTKALHLTASQTVRNNGMALAQDEPSEQLPRKTRHNSTLSLGISNFTASAKRNSIIGGGE